MDVLPLYIVLLLLFPPILWLLLRTPTAGAGGVGRALCADLAIRLELPSYPNGHLVLQSVCLAACCSCSAPGARSAAPSGSRRRCARR